MNTIKWALHYARMGYHVLPLYPQSKKPLTKLVPYGLKNATTDPQQIKRWWKVAKEAGIGLLPPENVLVLDIDAKEAWENLLRQYPTLQHAPRQRTPSKGYHVFLKIKGPVELSTTVNALPGVDIRGLRRAYVAVEPTTIAGKTYTWEVPLTSPETLPEAPQDLLRQLVKSRQPDALPVRETHVGAFPVGKTHIAPRLQTFCHKVATAPVGTRHNTLIRYALATGGLIPLGLDEEQAKNALLQAALESGLPYKEAIDAIQWGITHGKAKPLWEKQGIKRRGLGPA